MDELLRIDSHRAIYWNGSATFEVRSNGRAVEAFTRYDVAGDWHHAYDAAWDWWTGYGVHYIDA